jgi:DNA-binding NarL/FixJ family response regulator
VTATADSTDRSVRVLLVDDADPIRLLLRGLLGGAAGIEVVGEAGDGAEAIELARRLRPDVVLMDVTMPVLDGVSATAVITEELPGIRVLGLSISGDSETAERMVAAGAADYLTKGGAADDLIAAVRGRRPR